MSSFEDAFPDAGLYASGQVDSIDMLIGLDHAGMMPKEVKRIGAMMLFESQFQNGQRFLAAGTPLKNKLNRVSMAARISMLQDPGFLTTEALGTDPPRRCKT